MTLVIPWWAWPTLATIVAFCVTNWWPSTDTGVAAAVGGLFRLLFLIAFLAVLWIGILVWRLNS